MQRVVVVGPPGSGKTTLGAQLAERLGCDHIEMDGLWWEPNWTEAGTEKFAARVRPIAESARWVMDGNYFSQGAAEIVWRRADTVVWLDFPRRVTVPRVVRRTLRRSLSRVELWSGNRESIRLLRPDSIARFAWTAHPTYGARYGALVGTPTVAHLDFVRLRSRREVRRWLAAVASP